MRGLGDDVAEQVVAEQVVAERAAGGPFAGVEDFVVRAGLFANRVYAPAQPPLIAISLMEAVGISSNFSPASLLPFQPVWPSEDGARPRHPRNQLLTPTTDVRACSA